jgi:hypothetical protein
MDARPIFGALITLGSVLFTLWILRRVDARIASTVPTSDAARLLLN